MTSILSIINKRKSKITKYLVNMNESLTQPSELNISLKKIRNKFLL